MSKANINTKLKKFLAKFVRLNLHVYFNMNWGKCCTKAFIYGGSLTHGNWQHLFIQIIQYWPQLVKLVIIRALKIGLFLLLKCRQIWISKTSFWDSFLHQIYAQLIIPEIMIIGGRSQRTNNTNPKKLLSTMYCAVHCFIWIYLTAV